MTVSYDKLWKLLIDKKMNRTDLKNTAGVSFNVLAKMSRNEFVSLESLCKRYVFFSYFLRVLKRSRDNLQIGA